MFVCREAERLPYERTGGWAGSPGGGAVHGGGKAGVLQTAAAAACKRATAPQGRLLASRSGSGRVALRCQWQKKQGISVCSGRQMTKALAAEEDAGYRNRIGK